MLRRGHRQSCGNDPKLSFAQLWDRRQSKSDCQHSVRSFLHPRPCPRGTQPLSPCKCTTLVYFHSQVGRILCIRIEARGRRNHSSFVGRPEKSCGFVRFGSGGAHRNALYSRHPAGNPNNSSFTFDICGELQDNQLLKTHTPKKMTQRFHS